MSKLLRFLLLLSLWGLAPVAPAQGEDACNAWIEGAGCASSRFYLSGSGGLAIVAAPGDAAGCGSKSKFARFVVRSGPGLPRCEWIVKPGDDALAILLRKIADGGAADGGRQVQLPLLAQIVGLHSRAVAGDPGSITLFGRQFCVTYSYRTADSGERVAIRAGPSCGSGSGSGPSSASLAQSPPSIAAPGFSVTAQGDSAYVETGKSAGQGPRSPVNSGSLSAFAKCGGETLPALDAPLARLGAMADWRSMDDDARTSFGAILFATKYLLPQNSPERAAARDAISIVTIKCGGVR